VIVLTGTRPEADCAIRCAGLEALGGVLGTNSTLTSLNLQVAVAGVQHIHRQLSSGCGMIRVSWVQTLTTRADAVAPITAVSIMMDGLRANNTLVNLEMSGVDGSIHAVANCSYPAHFILLAQLHRKVRSLWLRL
jgi:hypothetical protein